MTQASSSLLLPAAEVLAPEEWPEVDHLVTEDDTPVDNIFSERQQHLLVEPLHSSWAGPGEGRPTPGAGRRAGRRYLSIF